MHSTSSIMNGVLTMVVVVTLLIFGVTALTNNDPLWFWKVFDTQAKALTVYWEGKTYVFYPGDPDYQEIMAAFAKGIARPAGFEWEVALSETSINHYHEEAKILEVSFAKPVQVHTRHPFPKAKTYLVPLDETHADWRRVFAFTGVVPRASGPLDMRTEDFEVLFNAVERAMATQE
jgi:hypothetical protein